MHSIVACFMQITVGGRNTAVHSVDQELRFVGNESGKLLALQELVRQGISPPVIVFVQSKERAKELFAEMIYDGACLQWFAKFFS